MAGVTTTGAGTTTTLVVSSVTNVAMTQNATTDLFQSGAVTVNAPGHTVLILARTQISNATLNNQCQVNIVVDGTTVFTDIAGGQIIYRQPLSAGSHTIDFNVYSFVSGLTMTVAGFTAIDLGL